MGVGGLVALAAGAVALCFLGMRLETEVIAGDEGGISACEPGVSVRGKVGVGEWALN